MLRILVDAILGKFDELLAARYAAGLRIVHQGAHGSGPCNL